MHEYVQGTGEDPKNPNIVHCLHANADHSLTGGLCGAAFIDMAFEDYVQTTIGEPAYLSIKKDDRQRMKRKFASQVKRTFHGGRRLYKVKLRGVKDCPEHHILNQHITVDR